MCPLEATQAAKRPDLKHGPLSVTIRRVRVSPVSGSTRSAVQLMPSSRSASASGCFEELDRVSGGLGDADLARRGSLGPAVHDSAEVPFARRVGLELREVGLPQPVRSRLRRDERFFARPGAPADLAGALRRQGQAVAGQHPVHRRVADRAWGNAAGPDALELGQLAMPPPLPSIGEGLGVGLDGVLGRRRPRPLRCRAGLLPAIPRRPRHARHSTEPGHAHPRRPALRVELGEAPCSEPPFFHSRNSM